MCAGGLRQTHSLTRRHLCSFCPVTLLCGHLAEGTGSSTFGAFGKSQEPASRLSKAHALGQLFCFGRMERRGGLVSLSLPPSPPLCCSFLSAQSAAASPCNDGLLPKPSNKPRGQADVWTLPGPLSPAARSAKGAELAGFRVRRRPAERSGFALSPLPSTNCSRTIWSAADKPNPTANRWRLPGSASGASLFRLARERGVEEIHVFN